MEVYQQTFRSEIRTVGLIKINYNRARSTIVHGPIASPSWEFMPPFLYRCPNTGQTVQGFTAEEVSEDSYEAVTCLACRRLHFVNPTTGKVLGGNEDE